MIGTGRELRRGKAPAQEMKSANPDAVITAWCSLSQFSRKAAILDTSGKVLRTFAQIEQEANHFEKDLLHKFAPGEVVGVQIGNHPAWPALLLALWRRQLVALPLEPTLGERELKNSLQTCSAAALLTTDRSGTTGNEQITLHSLQHPLNDWGPIPPSLLKLTSGTTAAPRSVRFRPEQLLADCTQICDTMGITHQDLNFGVIPISHSYGFSNLVTPLLARAVPMVLSNDRLPRAVLTDLGRTGASVFPGMPVFYQALADMENVTKLPRLRLCISAGAPLPIEVARKFREKFGHSIHSFYGSSECGGICYDRTAQLLEEGFVGLPMQGVNIESLEPDASATCVRIFSSAVADGYFPVADVAKLGDGKFIPDDLLRISEQGVQIVGRISDVINVAGKKVNPAEVEAELLHFAGVRAAVVFGRGSLLRNEEVAACVVAGPNVLEADLLEHCRAHLSSSQIPRRIYFVEAIPVNERGKINRRELANRFHQ